MALQKTLQISDNKNNSSVFDNVYIKVESVSSSKLEATITYSFNLEKNGFCLNRYNTTFAPDLNGSNFIKQAYEHLKTLPEFADAADV